jgi:hypothetical protein
MADGKDKYNIHIFKNAATEEGWCNGTAKYQHLKMSLQDWFDLKLYLSNKSQDTQFILYKTIKYAHSYTFFN